MVMNAFQLAAMRRTQAQADRASVIHKPATPQKRGAAKRKAAAQAQRAPVQRVLDSSGRAIDFDSSWRAQIRISDRNEGDRALIRSNTISKARI